ncbi:tyrosine-protein kinase Mer isoform X1 [Pristis pectinata]|uniref:tyrosine-protein kinase Mer isoform X1 n=1 Tax=Pristis pectinata TaxID=685728 RepID=UPI00223CE06B|nr:tyrosine-protein kinase Mer isoform X1 [Pristis pectinata]
MIRLNWLWVFTSFLHFACGFDLSHVPTPAGESQGTAESRSDAGKKIQFKPAAARITISQGNPVSFNCSIAVPGYQQDLRIKWLKNDKHLIDGDRCSFKGISFSDSEGTSTIMSSCRIENVVHSDAGAYYCWIQITDEPIESEKIILEIEGLPSFIREPESKNVSRNASFNLTCEAVGPPYPVNIHWLQDGITIKTIENTTLSVLNVAGVHKRTRYSCEAHNEKGVTVSRKAQVNVKEAPDPPVDLRIRNQTAHVVVISWEPGFDGYSSLNICQIQVEKDTRDEDNVMTYLTAVPPYKYRILDLQALTSYNISVSCKNEVGWSNCSPGIQAKTTEGVPTAPPRNISILVRNGSLTVEWVGPPEEEVNGILLGYELSYDWEGRRSPHIKSLELDNSRNFNRDTIKVVTTNVTYKIQVAAYTKTGVGPYSNPMHVFVASNDVTLPSTSTVPAVGDSKTDHSLMVLIGIVCISGIIVIVAFVYAAVKKRAKEMRFGNVFGDGEDMEPTVSYTVKKTYLRRTVELTLDNLGIREELKEKLQDVMIDRSLLTLGKVLGEGEFGSVVEGHIKQADGSSQKVAVKTMKLDDFSLREIEEFLSEAACMKDFDHPNVIKLLGVCLELGSREQIAKPMVILPFMKYGDLHSFLLRSRLETNAEYIPLQTLLKFMIDIASGMEYLSNRSFLHRDLAARNCMLQTDMTVCVADFGLSKKIYSGDYYRQGRIAKMPVKWIALESLADRVFTVKSDVWAFGITMWEIVTRGMTPYPGIQNHEIYEYLQANNRLKQPSDCLDEVYDIMYSCWRLDPADRPTFSDLKSILSKVLDGLPKIQGKEDIIYVNTGIPAEQRQLTEDAFSDIDLSDPTEAASCSLGCAEATVTVEVHRTLDLEDRYVASDVPEHQGNTADIETPLLHGVCLSNGVKLPPPKPNSGDIPFADDSSGDSVVIL